ncbi:hypothetical protein [Nocardia xishanensis]
MSIQQHITDGGKEIRIGQLYRDARDTNVRTLRVDAIEEPWQDWKGHKHFPVAYTVIRQEREPGVIVEPMRRGQMDAERLTGKDFVLLDGGEADR